MQMTLEETDGQVTRIVLAGRMDLEGTQAIDQSFAFATSTQPRRIAVDMSQVSFLASIGIRALLIAARAQAGRGGKLVLCTPDPMVRKVLATAGIDQVIPVFDDFAGACNALRAA
ncbi:MAG: STAS domain-containing protein [Betaproteobacteria bacterium]